MGGRSASSGEYRYGFNGKEKDDKGEWGGEYLTSATCCDSEGNVIINYTLQKSQTYYDYGFRIYNPGIAKFLSVDPLVSKYPAYSPYSFSANSPVLFSDPDGKDIIIKRIAGGGEDGKDLILITVNARIVDKTTTNQQIMALQNKLQRRQRRRGKGLKKKDAARLKMLESHKDYIENEVALEVVRQLDKAFSGQGNLVDWKFDKEGSSISFAKTEDEIKSNDNVLYAVDNVVRGREPDPQNYAKERLTYSDGGRAVLGGLASYYSLGADTETLVLSRIFAHEVGHNAGLHHPTRLFRRLKEKGIVSGSYSDWEKQYYSVLNVMAEAKREGGLNLEEHQVLQIEKLFKEGKLNIGSNEYDELHDVDEKVNPNEEPYEYQPENTNNN